MSVDGATKQTDNSHFTSPPSNPPKCRYCGDEAHFYIRQRHTIGFKGKRITVRILLCSDCCLEHHSLRCQECKSINLEKDFIKDTVSCRDCGLVHIESGKWIL